MGLDLLCLIDLANGWSLCLSVSRHHHWCLLASPSLTPSLLCPLESYETASTIKTNSERCLVLTSPATSSLAHVEQVVFGLIFGGTRWSDALVWQPLEKSGDGDGDGSGDAEAEAAGGGGGEPAPEPEGHEL